MGNGRFGIFSRLTNLVPRARARFRPAEVTPLAVGMSSMGKRIVPKCASNVAAVLAALNAACCHGFAAHDSPAAKTLNSRQVNTAS